jgi:hypothetical protein
MQGNLYSKQLKEFLAYSNTFRSESDAYGIYYLQPILRA